MTLIAFLSPTTAPQKLKGKMARMVATKAALSIRLDALADADSKSSLDSATIGLDNRAKLETRLRMLEQGMGHTSLRSIAKAAGGGPGQQKKFEMQGNGASYNTAADTLLPTAATASTSKAVSNGDDADEEPEVVAGQHADVEMDEAAAKAAKKAAKKAKKAKEAQVEGAKAAEEVDAPVGDDEVSHSCFDPSARIDG